MTSAADPVVLVGRLAAIAALVEAARGGELHLGSRLEECFAGEVPSIEMARGHELVWDGTALIALSSDDPPTVSVEGAEPVPMTRVPGTSYWFTLVPVEEGQLRFYKFVVEGEWRAGREIAGFTALSRELAGVTPGSLSERREVSSRIYPGATTGYWVYVNDGIDEVRRRARDGLARRGGPRDPRSPRPADADRDRQPRPPRTDPADGPPLRHAERAKRGAPDGVRRRRSAHAHAPVRDCLRSLRPPPARELLPEVEKTVKLRRDAYSRGSAGGSDGGHCAFKLAWLQPDRFSRAHCTVATFTAKTWDPEQGQDGGFIYEHRVRLGPKRNIRVSLSSGTNDIEKAEGSWPLGNIALANALKLNGYDFRFRFDSGYHSSGHSAIDLPDSLAWLWRGYDPDRIEQVFEQDAEERQKPPFRVSVVNRQ